jgi:hypothetical protein
MAVTLSFAHPDVLQDITNHSSAKALHSPKQMFSKQPHKSHWNPCKEAWRDHELLQNRRLGMNQPMLLPVAKANYKNDVVQVVLGLVSSRSIIIRCICFRAPPPGFQPSRRYCLPQHGALNGPYFTNACIVSSSVTLKVGTLHSSGLLLPSNSTQPHTQTAWRPESHIDL